MPDNLVNVSFDDIVTLLLPSATCWGEQDASDKPYTAIGAFPLLLSDLGSMGGEYTLTAQPTMPSDGAPQTGCPSSLARPSLQARLTTHLSLSNPPPPPTGQGGRSPTHTLLTVGESAASVASRALDRQFQRLAYTFYQGFADRNPWVMNRLYCTFDLNLQPPNLRQIHQDFWLANQPILWLR